MAELPQLPDLASLTAWLERRHYAASPRQGVENRDAVLATLADELRESVLKQLLEESENVSDEELANGISVTYFGMPIETDKLNEGSKEIDSLCIAAADEFVHRLFCRAVKFYDLKGTIQ